MNQVYFKSKEDIFNKFTKSYDNLISNDSLFNNSQFKKASDSKIKFIPIRNASCESTILMQSVFPQQPSMPIPKNQLKNLKNYN
mmetsp:Transcript_21291/g.18901  ORF Transcript_21291/g.18901 Transcript_21291/m.18901 type:complete len:84 (+) Transcript_21291:440-691(+)